MVDVGSGKEVGRRIAVGSGVAGVGRESGRCWGLGLSTAGEG